MAKIISGVGFNTVSKDGHAESIVNDLKYYSDIGADFAEVCLGTIDILAGGRVVRDRLAALANVTGQFPLRYSVHGLVSSNFMNASTLRHQIDVTKSFIEVCDAIGSTLLVQHSGFVSPDRPADRAEADKREHDALVEVAEVAAKYDVRVALENIFTVRAGEYRKTPTQVAETVRALDHPNVVATTDFSHAYIESTYRGLDYMKELSHMAPMTGHLHVHDSFGRPAGDTPFFYPQEASALGLGDLHLPIGWGSIPWEQIFAELTFLPGTILMMEISNRFRSEQASCLAKARGFAEAVNRRSQDSDTMTKIPTQ
ncbi:MAG: sugar phosphate isomerase/epimerase [Rhizobiaceae bacterium]|nr:MAG: sugar phosphate isomerase/epimerase [Rhizobiaceae bacterium]